MKKKTIGLYMYTARSWPDNRDIGNWSRHFDPFSIVFFYKTQLPPGPTV